MKYRVFLLSLTIFLFFHQLILPTPQGAGPIVSIDPRQQGQFELAGEGLAKGFLKGFGQNGKGFEITMNWGTGKAADEFFSAVNNNLQEDGQGRLAIEEAMRVPFQEMAKNLREGGDFDRARKEMAANIDRLADDVSNSAKRAIQTVGVKGLGSVYATLGLTTVATVAGVATAQYGSRVLWNHIEHKLQQPRLLIDSSKKGFFNRIKRWFVSEKPIEMALSDEQEQRLSAILKTTQVIKEKIKSGAKNVKYRNVLLWGPPGTGKTMFAKKLAKESGMDFAMITGSSLSGFKEGQAIVEIDKLFAWAQKSKKGLIIFIDEVDSLLSDRKNLRADSEQYKIVNHILNYTGERSDKVMLVMTTNHQESLDQAIFDRVDDMIHMPLPDKVERKKVLSLHAKDILFNEKENDSSFIKHTKQVFSATELADQTEGLSSRNLHGIINKILTNTHATKRGLVTKKIIERALQEEKEKYNLITQARAAATA